MNDMIQNDDEPRFECWAFIPGTNNRFAISNLGHFMKVAKKKRLMKMTLVVAAFEIEPVVCDYKSGLLGWYAWYDNQNHFFPRGELMSVFPPDIVSIDFSQDNEAIRKRELTIKPMPGK